MPEISSKADNLQQPCEYCHQFWGGDFAWITSSVLKHLHYKAVTFGHTTVYSSSCGEPHTC